MLGEAIARKKKQNFMNKFYKTVIPPVLKHQDILENAPLPPTRFVLQLKLKSATHQNKAGGKEGNGNAHDCPLRPGHLKSAVRLFSI